MFSFGITSILGVVWGILSVLDIKKSKGQVYGWAIAVTGITISAAIMILALAIILMAFLSALN